MKKSTLLEHVRTVNNKCPLCGSKNLTITDSFTIFGVTSLAKGNEQRMTPSGNIVTMSYRKNNSGNKSMVLCKDCGCEWEVTDIDNDIEVITK